MPGWFQYAVLTFPGMKTELSLTKCEDSNPWDLLAKLGWGEDGGSRNSL